MPYPCLFSSIALYLQVAAVLLDSFRVTSLYIVLFLTYEFFLTLMTGTIYIQSIETSKFVFGIITSICQYLFDGMLLRKHHRPTLLTSFHHKHLLLLHSLILSSLSLCLRLQMYFDKSFPHPFFYSSICQVSIRLSVCYLDTSAVTAITM